MAEIGLAKIAADHHAALVPALAIFYWLT